LTQESTFKPSLDDNKYPATCKVQHEGEIQPFQLEKDILTSAFFRDHIWNGQKKSEVWLAKW